MLCSGCKSSSVGHLPFLSRLASLLLVGDPERTLVRFRMGGIVCLTGGPSTGGWIVAWMLTPELAV
jgi:phosphohistidine phosphatase